MTQVTDEMVLTAWQVYRDSDAAPNVMFRTGLQALFAANLISLPVDTDRVREDVVREAMVLFEGDGFMLHSSHVRTHLQSLLPTKDRADELAEEFLATGPSWCTTKEAYENAFRWLIAREG